MYKFILIVFTFGNLISNAQSIYSRTIDSNSSITIFTTSDTIAIGDNECSVYAMILNEDSMNFYTLSYVFKAPKSIYLSSSYNLRIRFVDGQVYNFKNINEDRFFSEGNNVEFRVFVEKYQLYKMSSFAITSVRLQRDDFKYDIPINYPYVNKIPDLADFVLNLDVYKEFNTPDKKMESTPIPFPEN